MEQPHSWQGISLLPANILPDNVGNVLYGWRISGVRGRRERKTQQTLAAKDPDNPYPLGIAPVHNAKWRLEEFPQKGLIEFGHHSAQLGMVGQGLDAL